jgi:hypothetical protein
LSEPKGRNVMILLESSVTPSLAQKNFRVETQFYPDFQGQTFKESKETKIIKIGFNLVEICALQKRVKFGKKAKFSKLGSTFMARCKTSIFHVN